MSLPVKVKMGVRDHWNNPGCSAQRALANLQVLAGVPVTCEPAWPSLWETLKPGFEFSDEFVPAVAQHLVVWSKALDNLAQQQDWREQMLKEIKAAGSLAIRVEVSLHGYQPRGSVAA
jgi:hypothetical protein